LQKSPIKETISTKETCNFKEPTNRSHSLRHELSVHRRVLQCVAVCCSVLQCVAVCCSVLQCVAVCCSVLQCIRHELGVHHPLSPVIKLGIRHPRKKERKKERQKVSCIDILYSPFSSAAAAAGISLKSQLYIHFV